MRPPGRDIVGATPGRSGQLLATVRRAVFGVGPVATGRALLRSLRGRADAGTAPSGAGQPARPHPFDAEHGTDTGGFRSWRELQGGSANDPYISGYLGVSPSIGRHVIGLVENPRDYTFVDLGCGKGRALILASERPFQRVVGVEIAAGLAAVAAENAEVIRARYAGRPRIEVLHSDAASFVLPPGPLVLFLYQPFEMPVMRAVAANLATSLAASPRPAVVIYVHPVLKRAFDRLATLERAADGALEPTSEERPHTYAGQGKADRFIVVAHKVAAARHRRRLLMPPRAFTA